MTKPSSSPNASKQDGACKRKIKRIYHVIPRWVSASRQPFTSPDNPGNETQPSRSSSQSGEWRVAGHLQNHAIVSRTPGGGVSWGISPSISCLLPAQKPRSRKKKCTFSPQSPGWRFRGERVHRTAAWGTHQEAYEDRGPQVSWQRAPRAQPVHGVAGNLVAQP